MRRFVARAVAAQVAVALAGCGNDPNANAAASTAAKPGPAFATAAPAAQALPDPAADLYGGAALGEEFAPASALPGTPLRARKDDACYKLSNARIDPIGKQPFPVLKIDYQTVAEGPRNGQALTIRPASGNDRTILLAGPFQRRGTLEIRLGLGPFDALPKDAEFFLIRQEMDYGGAFVATFKVSNSATTGTPRLPLTMPRRWNAAEFAKLKEPPPPRPMPGAHPEAGTDTAFAGDAGAGSFRYAEPGKPMLGFEYCPGEWDKEACLATLVPVYDARQPATPVAQRVMAKEGYAVGALTVRSKRFVDAVQVTFMRQAGGKLDPSDSYKSAWLGPAAEGAKETVLGGDGRRAIGVHQKKGAILNGVALVME